MNEKLKLVRDFMIRDNIDAWLIVDFRGIDPTGEVLLGHLTPHSRLYAIIISPENPIVIIKSPVESNGLLDLDPTIQTFNARTQFEFMQAIQEHTKHFNRVALNYSDNPQTDVLPAGRFTNILKAVPNLTWVTGENLMQIINSVLSKEQIASHERAALKLTEIMKQAFSFIKDGVGTVTEAQVAIFIQNRVNDANLTLLEGPMVAAQKNAANPHYTPKDTIIDKNQLVMIDLWAKWDIFADITWMAYTGSQVPVEIQDIWNLILRARNAATNTIKPNISARIPDECAREIMIKAGYENAILHRTGHNIDTRSHGLGANLDSYEMPETRLLLPNTIVSVEPGIYLKGRFGVRSEINVLITNSGHRVTTSPQEKLLCL